MIDVRAATFLDPRFKLDWLSSQEQKDQVLTDIKKMLEESEAIQEGSTEEENDKDDLAEGLSELKRPRLFSFISPSSIRSQNQRTPEGSTVSLLLKQYVEKGTIPFLSNPMLYWKEVHPLKNLVRELMGVYYSI
ncbi:hypothetical protein Hamer_G026390 [Homarus americanus]|uniref:Uncharacterized protein n=1 Tax=Homarus americanus TaxID=6706 RepID=A0A8J5TN60_HOMAM|nr:hypothetical protein Hamer_G026390 [Homarus americanus]